MFLLLASEYDGPLKSLTVNGEPPLDAQLRIYMTDPRVSMHLVPAPASQKRPAPAASHGDKQSPPPAKKPRPGQKTPSQLPAELSGFHTKTSDNKPLCWNYNLSKGCANATKKGRCCFGFHTCMKCLKVGHGAHKCHSS